MGVIPVIRGFVNWIKRGRIVAADITDEKGRRAREGELYWRRSTRLRVNGVCSGKVNVDMCVY